MKVAFALFLILHGVIHVIGFVTSTLRIEVPEISGEPSFLLTGLDPSHWLLRVLGVLWLTAAIGFTAAGVGVWTDASWTLVWIIWSLVLSSILCLLWVKEAPFGLVANAIVLIVLLWPEAYDRVIPDAHRTIPVAGALRRP